MTNNPAIIWGTRRITWPQMELYFSSVMGQLKGLGIKPGDRVAICAPTCPEYIIVLFSLWRMKAIACPVSTRWPAAAINSYLLGLKVTLFLTTVQIKKDMPSVAVRTLHLNEVVCFDARRDFYKDADTWQPDLEQEVSIIATSGSTGLPKAAVHTWANHYYNARGSGELIELKNTDRWLLALPLYHVGGLAIVVRCFLAQAAMVIAQDDDLAHALSARQITHASFVTTHMHRLLSTPDGIEALKKLKYILLGGSAIAPSLIAQASSFNLSVYLSYGLTEMASQVATGKAGGCVKVLSHRELSISPDGEVLVKGKTLFKGYAQGGYLKSALTSDGWFKTGDRGSLDAHGCLMITGRKDNMFISGGENIQPEEVEKVLMAFPGIIEAVVVSVPDAEFGQRPVAFIKCAQEFPSKDALIMHCTAALPRFKIPTAFHPWPLDMMERGLKFSRRDLSSRLTA